MAQDSSQANARRLDELNLNFVALKASVDEMRQLLKGDGEDNPGLFGRMAFMERIVFGKEDQERGLMYKVNIMYRVHFWLVGVVCAAAGAGISELLHLLWK
jgi:hypothetical protein